MIYRAPPRYACAKFAKSEFPAELNPVIDYLKSFKVVAKQNEHNKNWWLNFTDDSPKNNLILTGGVGVGKTFLMHAFFDHLTENFGKKLLGRNNPDGKWEWQEYPIPVEYFRLKEIIDAIKLDWKEKNDGWFISQMKNIPLVVIDEIGVSYGTDMERTELFDMFNHRWEQMLPTIIISNLPASPKKEDEQSIANYLGTRLMDRLCDGALIVHLENATRRNHAENWAKK